MILRQASLLLLAATACARQVALGPAIGADTLGDIVDDGGSATTLSSSPVPATADGPSAFGSTIMSVLSASTEHGTFIHLLQRAKLVPVLARANATVFAPTDAAWDAWEDAHRPEDGDRRAEGWLGAAGLGEWLVPASEAEAALEARIAADPSEEERLRDEVDNQNWALRQHLLYHILNYTLPPKEWRPRTDGTSNITTETTLLYPRFEPDKPKPGPWLPAPEEALLGMHGQRLRLALPGSEEGGERGRVGFDHRREGGANVWDGAGWHEDNATVSEGGKDKDGDKGKPDKPDKPQEPDPGVRWARNGVVAGIEAVLEPPGSLIDVIRATPELAYLARLLEGEVPLPKPLPPWLGRAPHLTLFAASNEAFDAAFDDIERGYLEGGFGAEGLSRVLAPATLLKADGKDKVEVGWRDTWSKKGTTTESASGILEVAAPANGSLVVNGTEAEVVDIFAANGVIHVMPRLLLPEDFELLNSAEKVLLSRNATRFVSLMRSANLSAEYIGEPGKRAKKDWTILAPTDEAIELVEYWGKSVGPRIVESGNEHALVNLLGVSGGARPPTQLESPLAALLKYHIIAGRYTPSEIEDGMLLGSELRNPGLAGGRQRVRVEVSERRKERVGTDWDVEDGEISFGGAMVLGPPIKSDRTIIYFVSSLLSPPLDVLQTAVADLQLSTYIAAVYAAGLERVVRTSPATTYFIPRNSAFTNLGLAMKYLLLPEAHDDLRRVLRYHAVPKVVYTPDIETGMTVLTTSEGGNIVLERTKNGTMTLRSPSKWDGHDSGAALPANGDLYPAAMTRHGALTETGVIHVIGSVVMPADVNINIGMLMRGSKERTMTELMVKAGLGWILEGREPTEAEVERAGLKGAVRARPSDDEVKLGVAGGGNDDAGDDGDDKDTEPDPDPSDRAFPAYTVLMPTDKAFSRLNLTHYLGDKDALLSLLKLHIIPSNLNTLPKASEESRPRNPPVDGAPLALEDAVVYPTLLAGEMRFGELAFRQWGEHSFIVGVHNARGSVRGARTGAAGRASVRWRHAKTKGVRSSFAPKDGNKDDGETETTPLWRGGMTLGGGVVVIDTVLEPYDPGWFERWGWLALTITGATAVLVLVGVSTWWWWSTTARDGYERVSAEEDERDEREQEEANRHWRRQSRSGGVSGSVGSAGAFGSGFGPALGAAAGAAAGAERAEHAESNGRSGEQV